MNLNYCNFKNYKKTIYGIGSTQMLECSIKVYFMSWLGFQEMKEI